MKGRTPYALFVKGIPKSAKLKEEKAEPKAA